MGSVDPNSPVVSRELKNENDRLKKENQDLKKRLKITETNLKAISRTTELTLKEIGNVEESNNVHSGVGAQAVTKRGGRGRAQVAKETVPRQPPKKATKAPVKRTRAAPAPVVAQEPVGNAEVGDGNGENAPKRKRGRPSLQAKVEKMEQTSGTTHNARKRGSRAQVQKKETDDAVAGPSSAPTTKRGGPQRKPKVMSKVSKTEQPKKPKVMLPKKPRQPVVAKMLAVNSVMRSNPNDSSLNVVDNASSFAALPFSPILPIVEEPDDPYAFPDENGVGANANAAVEISEVPPPAKKKNTRKPKTNPAKGQAKNGIGNETTPAGKRGKEEPRRANPRRL